MSQSDKSILMQFTFGIITGGGQEDRINEIITSIESQKIPTYEIIIIGSCFVKRSRTKIIDFDETVKKLWISKKKNMVAQLALHENIVFLHDYIKLLPGWYSGWQQFGNNFSIGMNQILNYDGTRYRDWTLWAGDVQKLNSGLDSHECLLPYDISHLTKFMYISGAYWIAKKAVMLEIPFDEKYGWGEGEDVYWSEAVRAKYQFSMNPKSIVQLMKDGKEVIFRHVMPEQADKLRALRFD